MRVLFRGCRMVRSHAAAGSAITGNGLPYATDKAEAAAPEATEAATAAPRRIVGTPTHGYEPTREAAMSLISLNVGFQGQPGPHCSLRVFLSLDPQPTCSGSSIRISSSIRIKAPSTLRCQIRGAIGCVSLVEKRVLNAGSDGGNLCDGANSSHFLPALPLLDRRRLSLRHARFTASVR